MTALPSNDDLEALSSALPWQDIEKQKLRFNEQVRAMTETLHDDSLPLDQLSEAAGVPIVVAHSDTEHGTALLAEHNGHQYILGSFVSKRYRHGKTLLRSIVPYNFNPSVNHTNIHQTENPLTELRALGAELELGLYRENGDTPEERDVQTFIEVYRHNAHKLGITPQVDREACRHQVEVHVAPGIGYHRLRKAIDSIMISLVAAGDATGLYTAIMSAYPLSSEFETTPDPKVETAVDVMVGINNRFPAYRERQAQIKSTYHMDPNSNAVQTFRLQGCHIHIDIAGRSEALGLLVFSTMLRSASALANSAMLKGGPFVNGTCDVERLCTREHLRSATVTGRYIDRPLSPHTIAGDMDKYSLLLQSDLANAAARALLYDDELGQPISAMHNPIGRVRPDLGMKKRICTIESTGMPVNVSASRQAAALADFEFTQALVENYFRQHGLNLEPMADDPTLWAIIGPLSRESFIDHQERSDRDGTDITLTTAAGMQMSLPEFYEMKRRYMHRHLIDVGGVLPRDIDDVYASINRMLDPPSGRVSQTIEQYIADPTYRGTGNWGKILRSAFVEEGGVLGKHQPEPVLRVANRIHNALRRRYLQA